MSRLPNLKEVVFKDTTFANLMQKRIYNVLLIATRYDAFMLEDDGRVDEQIFNEYTALSLSSPPRFTQVTTQEEAMHELQERNFELIICMPNMDKRDIFAVAGEIKAGYPSIPIVVLTPFSREVSKRIAGADLSSIDYVFSWLGNAELLLAIIKLLEDKMNAPDDTRSAGVQIILLVEDSIRFYSSALPHLFRFVLEQSQEFSKEALNDHQQNLRMRGRPKIMLARTYEEATGIIDQYRGNILGVVSDLSFMREGEKDPMAGYRLAQRLHNLDPTLPLVLESSDPANRHLADEVGASFVDKNSKSYPQDLRREITSGFGFGDFVIINPATGDEIMRIHDLKDLQQKIFEIPDDALRYHLSRNHFSRFFYSRAMFPPAELLRKVDVNDYSSMDEARHFIFNIIVEYRHMKNLGVVAVFRKDRFDRYSNLARIGNGSLGGKGRGLAFMSAMVKRHSGLAFDKMDVEIPHTVVISTDVFDEFMEANRLYPIALSDAPDAEILQAFLQATLPERLLGDVMAFFNVIGCPVAIRSSSLLEDSHYQPFAGIYSTYMMPPLGDPAAMLEQLRSAIKAVYASVFYKDSKAYMTATQNLIDQEKMAVVLQEVVGSRYGNRYYPVMSGVARSLNFYPIGNETPEEGIANVALGLGKYIVDGGVTLRFSPAHPHNVLQTSTLDLALRETQTKFYALNVADGQGVQPLQVDDAYNLLKLSVRDAEGDASLRYAASTFDAYDLMLRDGVYPGGRKVITFANILQNDAYPVAQALAHLLEIGAEEMGRPVEIEFALNIPPTPDGRATFFVLQIRPIVASREVVNEDLSLIAPQQCIVKSPQALGQGIVADVADVVYVKTADYNAQNNQLIAQDIEQLNREFVEADAGYVLIGPGRWGSSDPWLGIPVKWPHISAARVIVEVGLKNYAIEPSQGTHFFQNLTSFGVGYFGIAPYRGEGLFDEAYLNALPAVHETRFLRHVRLASPAVIKMDGRHSLGVVLKPESATP